MGNIGTSGTGSNSWSTTAKKKKRVTWNQGKLQFQAVKRNNDDENGKVNEIMLVEKKEAQTGNSSSSDQWQQ